MPSEPLMKDESAGSPIPHHEYTTCQSNRGSNTFVDFISNSPSEILRSIVGYLDQDTAVTCTTICHTWRNIMLNCPLLWRTVDVYLSPKGEFQPPHGLLVEVSQHVEKLVYRTYLQSIKLINMFDFPNISSLEISDAGTLIAAGADRYIYDVLLPIQETLTELVVNFGRKPIPISLGRIFSTCPKLTTFICNVPSKVELSISQPTLLSRLEINNIPYSLSINDLEHLFQYSPCLRYLKLGMNTNDDILPLLGEHCPKLAVIITNQYQFMLEDDNPILPKTTNLERHDGRLEFIALHSIQSAIPLLPRLERSTETLRALYIASSGENTSNWSALSTFTLNKLTTLSIHPNHNRSLYENIPAILRCCSNLKTVQFGLPYALEDDKETSLITQDIFLAMAKLSKLVTLTLAGIDLRSTQFSKVLEQSTIKKLAICECTGVTSDLLRHISKTNSLEQLTLYRFSKQVNALDTEEFFHSLGQLPHLTHVSIFEVKFNDIAAQNLAASRSLKFASLFPSSGLTSHGEKVLRDRLPGEKLVIQY